MPYIQLQLSSDKFLDMFREGLAGQFVDAIEEHRIDELNASLLVERVELTGTTTIDDSGVSDAAITWGAYKSDPQQTTVPCRRYIVVQPLTLHSTLLLGVNTPTPTEQFLPTVAATIKVEVEAWIADDLTVQPPNPVPDGWTPPQWVPHLFLQPQSFELHGAPAIPGVPPAVVAAEMEKIRTRLASRLRSSAKKINAKTPSGQLDFVNTGLAFDPEKTRMSILMQTPPSLEARLWVWERFHNRELDDLLQSGLLRHDWAQATDSVIVEGATSLQIESGLKEKADEMKPKGVPGVTWSTPNNTAHLSVSVPIERNAPDPLAGTIDLDLSAEMSYSVAGPGILKMDLDIRADVTGASFNIVLLATASLVVGVALLSGFTWMLFGPFYGLALSSALGTGLALLNTIKGPSLSPGDVEDFVCTEGPVSTDDFGTTFTQHITCTKPEGETFSLEGGRSARLILQEVRGLPSTFTTRNTAMVTSGSIEMPRPQDWGFELDATVPRWLEPEFPCGSSFITVLAFHRAGQILVRARGQIIVTPHHEHSPVIVREAKLCSADPLNVKHDITIESWGTTTWVNLYIRWVEAYQNAPYPFWILLRTTKGFRLVKIDPPPFLSKEDMEHKALGGVVHGISDCYARSAPFFAEHQGINVKFIPDPPPDFREVEYLWQVTIRGLAPAERVQVTRQDQVALGEFQSTTRGETVFMAKLGTDVGRALSLQRLRTQHSGLSLGDGVAAPSRHTHTGETDVRAQLPTMASCESGQQIDVEQTVLLRQARLTLDERTDSLDLDILAGVLSAAAVGRQSLTVFDLTVPSRPSIRASISVHGLRGVVMLADSLLVFGEFGLVKAPWNDIGIALVNRHRCCDSGTAAGSPSRSWTDVPVRSVRPTSAGVYALVPAGIAQYTDRGRDAGLVIPGAFDDFATRGRYVFTLARDVVQVHAPASDADSGGQYAVVGEIGSRDAVALVTPRVGPPAYLFVRNRRRGGSLFDVSSPAHPELVSSHGELPLWATAVRRRGIVVAIDRAGAIDVYSTEASAHR